MYYKRSIVIKLKLGEKERLKIHNFSISGRILRAISSCKTIFDLALSDKLTPDSNMFRTNLFRPTKFRTIQIQKNDQINGFKMVQDRKFHQALYVVQHCAASDTV